MSSPLVSSPSTHSRRKCEPLRTLPPRTCDAVHGLIFWQCSIRAVSSPGTCFDSHGFWSGVERQRRAGPLRLESGWDECAVRFGRERIATEGLRSSTAAATQIPIVAGATLSFESIGVAQFPKEWMLAIDGHDRIAGISPARHGEKSRRKDLTAMAHEHSALAVRDPKRRTRGHLRGSGTSVAH